MFKGTKQSKLKGMDRFSLLQPTRLQNQKHQIKILGLSLDFLPENWQVYPEFQTTSLSLLWLGMVSPLKGYGRYISREQDEI